MAKDNYPSLPFWYKDFEADENVKLMNLEQVGAYLWLLIACWHEGSLPTDLKKLAAIAKYRGRNFQDKIWTAISPCFTQNDARLFHRRLDIEREKIKEKREKLSQAGRNGANKRHHNTDGSILNDHSQAIARLLENHSQAIPDIATEMLEPGFSSHNHSHIHSHNLNKENSQSLIPAVGSEIKKPTDFFLNFDEDQILKIKAAISVALNHDINTTANQVNFREFREKMEKYVNKSFVPQESRFDYVLKSARNLGKPKPELEASPA